ncbi:MAG: interleukin-like EMT inducer domain-containing protein [Cyanobacteriota bacterium]|nr:interleukin-like EMT inducer domain-containing protein [Cyanobacteriota bacterium]
MTTQKIAIAATSGGYYGGNNAQILANDREIGFGNYGRGINVAIFDETTGLPLFSTSFDTPIGNSDIFADFIDSVPAGRIVALAVKGDAGSLTERAKTAIKSLGSAQIDNLQASQSYALIGIKGRGSGTARESIDGSETSSSYSFDVEAVREIGSFVVEAISKPSTMGSDYSVQGGEAQMMLGGKLLNPEGGYRSGWNLMVLDRTSGRVKRSSCFNPQLSAEVEQFAQSIQDLPAGEIVAIATQDYTGTESYNSVEKACASIGATLVGKLTYGGSWAVVGYKGAKAGHAVENLDNISSSLALHGYSDLAGEGVRVKYWHRETAPVQKEEPQPETTSKKEEPPKPTSWVDRLFRFFTGE